MQLGPAEYLAAFLVSSALAWVLTPVMLRVALRRSILDVPDERKAQKSPVPYLGGVAIVLAFAVTVLVAGVVTDPPSGVGALAAVLGAGLLLALTGLLDDLRGLSPYLRLAMEIGAGVVGYLGGREITVPGPAWLDVIVAVVWGVGGTNALSPRDNMGGLSGGVATSAALSFCAIGAVNGQLLVAAL